jgi:hypothetical protein
MPAGFSASSGCEIALRLSRTVSGAVWWRDGAFGGLKQGARRCVQLRPMATPSAVAAVRPVVPPRPSRGDTACGI